MGDARTRARLGAAALLLAAAAPAAPPVTELRWLAPGRDPVAFLGRRPAECLALPIDPAAQRSVETGRAAFRSPLLLGGQAARAGLSCEACHRGGRDNPDFHFAGISGAPGTADVTASLLSRKRGDGIDNPVPIPDLAAPATHRDSPALEAFIAGLIVEEFDGAPPPPAVLAGLAAYVRALTACAGDVPVRLADDLAAVDRALAAAQTALAGGDRATAALLIDAARGELRRIDERFAAPALARVRARLPVAGTSLGAVNAAVRGGDPGATARLTAWRARWSADAARLAAAERFSLYDPSALARLRGTASGASSIGPANGISPSASGTNATPGRNSRSAPDS